MQTISLLQYNGAERIFDLSHLNAAYKIRSERLGADTTLSFISVTSAKKP
ncbi:MULTISPECIES: hypothetical protein [Rhizobium]|uniref:Uncharacterized protein n=1 Tax=Rhizobium metallidurans TaxID=1265931 RepID=A0A7W6D2K5_9HYPH|nr:MULTISPECIES: hypothetical protein [Rhizobium]MBB3967026.1 hypothetical protein [Rhizobium metallidurans]